METIEVIKRYMATIRKMMDSGKLNSEEMNALEFAHELAEYEFYAEIQKVQDLIDEAKASGMTH